MCAIGIWSVCEISRNTTFTLLCYRLICIEWSDGIIFIERCRFPLQNLKFIKTDCVYHNNRDTKPDEDDDDNENDGWQTIIRLSNELKWWTPFIKLQFHHSNMQFQMVYGSESKEKINNKCQFAWNFFTVTLIRSIPSIVIWWYFTSVAKFISNLPLFDVKSLVFYRNCAFSIENKT